MPEARRRKSVAEIAIRAFMLKREARPAGMGSPTFRAMADEQKAKLRLEIAHVLFMDIVGYSRLHRLGGGTGGMRPPDQSGRARAATFSCAGGHSQRPGASCRRVNQRANVTGARDQHRSAGDGCGDVGHILLSKHVADDLEGYPRWREALRDLGECEAPHGLRISVVQSLHRRSRQP